MRTYNIYYYVYATPIVAWAREVLWVVSQSMTLAWPIRIKKLFDYSQSGLRSTNAAMPVLRLPVLEFRNQSLMCNSFVTVCFKQPLDRSVGYRKYCIRSLRDVYCFEIGLPHGSWHHRVHDAGKFRNSKCSRRFCVTIWWTQQLNIFQVIIIGILPLCFPNASISKRVILVSTFSGEPLILPRGALESSCQPQAFAIHQ